ncbi:MAG TPA: hypothetical protein VF185_00850 [Patescibacteria group bacterium]
MSESERRSSWILEMEAETDRLTHEAPKMGELTWDFVFEKFDKYYSNYIDTGHREFEARLFAHGIIYEFVMRRMMDVFLVDAARVASDEEVRMAARKESTMLRQSRDDHEISELLFRGVRINNKFKKKD